MAEESKQQYVARVTYLNGDVVEIANCDHYELKDRAIWFMGATGSAVAIVPLGQHPQDRARDSEGHPQFGSTVPAAAPRNRGAFPQARDPVFPGPPGVLVLGLSTP